MWDWITSSSGAAVATWLQAIGTVGALFWLTWDFTVWRPRRQERQVSALHESHARSVALKSDYVDGIATISVLNASPYPIYRAYVKVWAFDRGTNKEVIERLYLDETILPGQEFEKVLEIDLLEDEERFDFEYDELFFMDVWANHWRRSDWECEQDEDFEDIPPH